MIFSQKRSQFLQFLFSNCSLWHLTMFQGFGQLFQLDETHRRAIQGLKWSSQMERPSVAKIGEPGTGKKSPKSHQSSIKLRITVLPQKTKANNKHQVQSQKSTSTINTTYQPTIFPKSSLRLAPWHYQGTSVTLLLHPLLPAPNLTPHNWTTRASQDRNEGALVNQPGQWYNVNAYIAQ